MKTSKQTAFVTGASRGIGRAIALGLAESGWNLGIIATDEGALAELAAEIHSSTGSRVSVAAADVGDYRAVSTAVTSLIAEVGVPQLLVNNAGRIDTEVPVWEADPSQLRAVVETNLLGTLYVERAVLSAVLDHNLGDSSGVRGRVVNLVSGAGANSWGVASAYTTSKAAQLRNVGDVDEAGASLGIRAFGVAPGVVRTDMTTSMAAHAGREEFTPVEATVELVCAIGRGELDAWSGRYLRAGTDTADSLTAVAGVLDANPEARRFAVVPWGDKDPLF